MSGRSINDLTDEDLEGMTAEEIAELEGANDTFGGDEDDDTEDSEETEDEEESEEADEEEEADEGEEEEETEDGEDDAAAEAERLRLLAEEGESDGQMVPLRRLNEVLAERDDFKGMLKIALENRGVTMVPAQAPAQEEADPNPRPEYDFAAANREMLKLLGEGEDDKAAAKGDEIEAARAKLHAWDLEQVRIQSDAAGAKRFADHQAGLAMQAVVTTLYKAYPFLNDKAKGADADAILAVNAKAKALVASGKYTAAQALAEAGESIGKKFAKLLGVSTPKPEKGKKGDKPAAKDAAAKAGEQRAKGARDRGLSVRQPDTGKNGVGFRNKSGKVDMSKMSDEQIEKMSPAELEEALGYGG